MLYICKLLLGEVNIIFHLRKLIPIVRLEYSSDLFVLDCHLLACNHSAVFISV